MEGKEQQVAGKVMQQDVVIVGNGATGGAGKVPGERGLNVVRLAPGPWLKPKGFSGDEIKYANHRNFLVHNELLNLCSYSQNERATVELSIFSFIPQMVGGGTADWADLIPHLHDKAN
jgi:hypothetical protein